ncbi:MAG TPA: TIGR03087 family PEP-CTERM/XrtA system glycosyltransferase [Bryobacteraceae bacterium]|nr:TIGR03087 family PEP-CTERM/XrtA system glycosyltransferase [Bryobacteraceae bacterium]
MDILFVSHCVPNPPDKGEKIRAWHELNALAAKHRVHLACFAKNREEAALAGELNDRCASVFAEPLSSHFALAGAALRFAMGGSISTGFYRSARMERHIESLRPRLAATVAYSSAVVQFAPLGIPLWIDMVDVDSEKWLEYGRRRRPGAIYSFEGRRLRALEAGYAQRAECVFVTTPRERDLLKRIAPSARVESAVNGVDFDFFNPAACQPVPELRGRQYVAFVGQMDYFPNVDACGWFADSIFPSLRKCWPNLQFLVVGRNPARSILRLARRPGIAVTGAVGDVRPYLAGACALVAPLRIARGVQNKVLEGLAMGKRVLASPAVAGTFGDALPEGVSACESAEDYARELAEAMSRANCDLGIRDRARILFSWDANLRPLLEAVELARARATGQKAAVS